MEDTDQRGPGIENGSEWSNGTVHLDRTGPTEKSGPPRWTDFSKTFPVGPNRSIHFWNGSRPQSVQHLNSQDARRFQHSGVKPELNKSF